MNFTVYIVMQSKTLYATKQSIGIVQVVVFPYYITFLKNAGSSYEMFGLLYGTFTLASALMYLILPLITTIVKVRTVWSVSCGMMMISMMVLPWVETLYEVFILQAVMGAAQALYKCGEDEWIRERKEHWKRNSYQQARIQVGIVIAFWSVGMLADYTHVFWLFLLSGSWYGYIMIRLLRQVRDTSITHHLNSDDF